MWLYLNAGFFFSPHEQDFEKFWEMEATWMSGVG